MNDVLLIFLSLSISGSILALVLMALKPLIKNRLSQTWQYYIWLIVILRFLLPLTPQVSVVGELSRLIQNISNPPVVMETDSDLGMNEEYESWQAPDNIQTSQASDNPQITKAPQNIEPQTPIQPIYWHDIINNIWLFWIGVALVLFAHKAASYRSFARFIKIGTKHIADEHILDIYQAEFTAAKIKRKLSLYENNHVVSPMLVGFVRPALVTPALEVSDGELRNILRHEFTHYKRMDFLYKWLVQITLCLHWFNPLMYLINKRINRSCELSCDEAVIKHLDEDGRIIYGDALMASLKAQGNYSNFVITMTMSENGNIVKERLDMIMNYKKKSKWIVSTTVILTMLLLCAFNFTGAYAANETKQSVPASWLEQSMGNSNQQANSIAQSQQMIDKRLSLIEKEYTKADLRTLNVSGIVIEVLSENVVVTRGGKALKLKYYQMSNNEYVIDTQPDMGGTIEELSLRRTTPLISNEPRRTIYVTIPDNIDFKVIHVETDSGTIEMEGCISKVLNAETQSGQITITGGLVDNMLLVKSKTGNIQILGISTDSTANENFKAFLEAITGTVTFQPKDSVQNYQFIIDTGANAKITVNGKPYQGGDFILHKNATKKIYFDSGYLYDNGLGSASFIANQIIDDVVYSGDKEKSSHTDRTDSLIQNFEKYRSFGVIYDAEQDAVYYNGKRVRLFVDFKTFKEEGMTYAFDLCYQDSNTDSTLYLEVVKDNNGNITKIKRLDEEIASDLLTDMAAAYQERTSYKTDNKNVIMTMDATEILESYGIVAKDLTKDKAAKNIKSWMEQCDKKQGAYVLKSKTASGYTIYIYYNLGGRYPWNMSVDNNAININLYSNSKLSTTDGYYLMYFTAPKDYKTINLYLDNAELNYQVSNQ